MCHACDGPKLDRSWPPIHGHRKRYAQRAGVEMHQIPVHFLFVDEAAALRLNIVSSYILAVVHLPRSHAVHEGSTDIRTIRVGWRPAPPHVSVVRLLRSQLTLLKLDYRVDTRPLATPSNTSVINAWSGYHL